MRNELNSSPITYVGEPLLGGSSFRLAGDKRDDVLLALGHGYANYFVIASYLHTMIRCFTSSTKIVSNPIALFLNIPKSFTG